MDKKAWKNQERIFHKAIALIGEERESFLKKTCPDEAQMSEVRTLIDAFETGGAFLEKSGFDGYLTILHEINKPRLENTDIGSYRIGARIGEGGMGEVYDAVDLRLNRRVALKFLAGSFTDDNVARRQLVREAQAAAMLDHENICAVYGIEQIEEHHFIVMQYIDGSTLAEFIKESRVGGAQVTAIIRQIVSGAAFAHSHGVIHRDLKPANIMIKEDGQIKVLDFGLAKTVRPVPGGVVKDPSSAISRNGLIIGTVSYMSPEQLRGERLDFQTDIFSIGIILYELISGCNPFTRNSQAETIASVLSHDPAPLATVQPDIPASISAIVQRCLEKDKAKRFQSAAEILVELDSAAPPAKIGIAAKLRIRPIIQIAAALVILMLLSGAVFFYNGYGRKKRSFAVLPFINDSGRQENQDVADGFTHDLTAGLSGISALDLKNETLVSRFKDRDVAPEKAGLELSVDAVLSGSISMRGNLMIVSVKIVKSADGSVQNADEFSISESTLTSIREAIVARVIETIPEVSEALRNYSQGRYYWNRRKGNDMLTAIDLFTTAVDLDPSNARAWAGLADAYSFLTVPGQVGSIPRDEAFGKAKKAAENAIRNDPGSCEARSALGTIKLRFDWDWAGAEQDFRTAISFAPDCAPAHGGLSNLLLTMGRLDESLVEAEKVKKLEPYWISADLNIGRTFYFKRDYPQAERIFSAILRNDPEHIRALYLLGFVYLQTNRIPEATRIFEKINDTKPLLASSGLGYSYGRSGQMAKAEAILGQLKKLSDNNYVSSQESAIIYLGMRNTDNAIKRLEEACSEKFPAFPGLLSDPLTDDIRSDPGFDNLRKCAGL